MRVEHQQDLGDGHRIEIGEATWGGGARSVRNRYPTATGGFSPHSSSEVPLRDLVPMLRLVGEHDELSVAQCAEIVAALAASVLRRCSG